MDDNPYAAPQDRRPTRWLTGHLLGVLLIAGEWLVVGIVAAALAWEVFTR